MRWGYSNLSLIMWLALAFYVGILAVFFKLVSDGKNKKKAFNLAALGLVGIHSILLISLGLNDSVASVRRVGFEVWVCGKQVQIVDSSPTGRIFRDGAFFSDKYLNTNSDEDQIKIGPELKNAGLAFSDKSVEISVSKGFEFKLTGDGNLDWLNESLKYKGNSNEPSLVIEDGSLTCPNGENGSWNIFLAEVNNDSKTYSWKKVNLIDLNATLTRAFDGNAVPDCLVMDYDIAKSNPEYRCADILKNDAKRCPQTDKSTCEYREVKT